MTWQVTMRVTAPASLVAAAIALVLGVVGTAVSPTTENLAWFMATALLGLPSLALGAVITARAPDNAVGPLLCLHGLVLLAVGATDAYTRAALREPGGLPGSDLLVAVGAGGWVWFYVPASLLLLVFPDGHFLSPRWRIVGLALPVTALTLMMLIAVSPEPYTEPFADAPHVLGTAEWATPAGYALLPVLLALLVAAMAGVAVRWRRSTSVRRAQLTWLALGGTTVPATLLLCWASYLFLDGPDLVVVGLALIWLALPLATGVAVLRHDLYDVDRAVSLAVTYAITTAGVLGTFTAVSVLGGVLLGRGSPTAAALATAAALLLLNPVRRRVQQRVERRLYPLRRDALVAIDDLAARARTGRAQPEDLEQVLRTALRDPRLRVGYRLPGAGTLVDAAGAPLPVGEVCAVPVRLGDAEIGVISFDTQQPGALREAVTDRAALIVEVVRLRVELRAALEDARSSRSRLLHAGYAERRRLERDLHDGAQQRLVSLGMSLRVAQNHLGDGTVDVDGLLDVTVAELATSVAELRQLAHGLRPSSLDDGLGPALANLTSGLTAAPSPIAVALTMDPTTRNGTLPDDVTTTAYFVASEALANVVKHAAADRIDLGVSHRDDAIRVRIADNGRGGAAVRPGSGLAALTDRVAALGGSLAVSSPAAGGTVVEAVLPCAS